MAVPKKRTSKARTRTRKAVWKAQARKASQKSFSFAQSLLKGRQTSYLLDESVEEEESGEQN
jgi:large subunit ribosomal protein L32